MSKKAKAKAIFQTCCQVYLLAYFTFQAVYWTVELIEAASEKRRLNQFRKETASVAEDIIKRLNRGEKHSTKKKRRQKTSSPFFLLLYESHSDGDF